MAKVGVIRCDAHSENCPGTGCFAAMRDRAGKFAVHEEVEIVGFDTCGGCGRGKPDKILSRAQRLKDKGAEAIHLGNCLVGACPSKEIYVQALKDQVEVEVIEGTHA